MAPSIVLATGGRRLVVGSAGSIRLRGAILQIVVNVVDHGLGVGGGDRGAARPPRRGGPPLEGGIEPAEADALEARGYDVDPLGRAQPLLRRRRRGRDLGADGRLEAAGDPRRGGAGVVVGT